MVTKKVGDKQKRMKWFICFILLFIVTIYGGVYADKIIKPNMAAIAEVKVKSIITQIINDSVHDRFTTQDSVLEMLSFHTDNEGNITFVQSNSIAMNNLATELTQSVQNQLKTIEPKNVKVPVGSILGSQILSQVGPSVTLKVIPIGTARMNFKTEFESTGINQTKYKVFLELNSQARVLAPFAINNINVKNTVLIAEAIIVGEVPDNYIVVPKENILDATQNTNQ